MSGGLDTVGWYLATMHQLLGHDATAAFIGAPAGDKAACVQCQHESDPSPESRQAVIRALAPGNEADPGTAVVRTDKGDDSDRQ